MAESPEIKKLKMVLRETDIPFFTPSQLEFYLAENNGDVNATIYECLLLKSEDTSLSVSGLSTADTSSYFKRLASRYRQFHSGTLKGG